MDIELKGLGVAWGSNDIALRQVQNMINLTMIDIAKAMTKALMADIKQFPNLKEFAKKHTSITLSEDLFASDQKTQIVYRKLSTATKEFIVAKSNILAPALRLIEKENDYDWSGDMFLGTFVLPKAKSLTERIQQEYPEALENKSLIFLLFLKTIER